MKSKKLKINILCLLCILIFPSCAEKLNISVNVIDNEKIEITNLGTKTVSNLDIRIFSDIDREAGVYIKNIASISSNEKIIFPVEELKNAKGNGYPKEQKIKSIRFANGKDTSKELYTWNYTPVYSNPAGYIFTNDKLSIQFYKYYKEGFIKTNQDTNSFIHNGKYHMENDKIVIECGKWIWDGVLEDDELRLEIRGGHPAGASFLFTGKETLYREKSYQESKKNIQPNEKSIDYETILLYDLDSKRLLGKSNDEIVNEYIRIYHNDDYQKNKDNEFVWHDKLIEYTKEFKDKIAKLNDEYSVRLAWELDNYDFEKEGFVVDFAKKDSIRLDFMYNDVMNRTDLNLAYLEKNYPYVYQPITLAIPRGGVFGGYKPLSFVISMEKDKAQKFLEARKTEDGKTDKSIQCIIYYKVSKGFYKIEVYDNENDMNLLYRGSIK